VFYTQHVVPTAAHIVDQNLELARAAGAQPGEVKFPLVIPPEAERAVDPLLATQGMKDFFLLSPGGGWRAKCWPPERYGELHRALAERWGIRGVVNYGPGEEALADAVRDAAGDPEPLRAKLQLGQFLALVRRARFAVSGDSGPLHVAVALGTPVVGLYGPTDPARNGPYSRADVVVRNAGPGETTYRRSDDYAPSMLSITVEQVLAAVERRMGQAG
jgi:heptosyltransferase-1